MSTLFGICMSNGGSIDPVAEAAVTKAMHHWEPDDSGSWKGEGVLLGHLMLQNTPESLHESNPFHNAGCHIVSDARLDNRREILQLMSGERDLSDATPDSHLILRLYLRFGASCLDHLIGDFAFAIWDARSRELFLARDHIGVRPLFYHHVDGLFVFASESRGILNHPSVSRSPDADFVHRLMGGIPPVPESTFHQAVKRLLPAHWARFSNQGLSIGRYWSLRRPERMLEGDPLELEAGFREILQRSVSDRLRSVHPVGCELSGGLDSSAVTTLAALSSNDKSGIHTFSAVLPRDVHGSKPFTDEEHFADEVIRHSGIPHPVKVSGSGRTGFFEFQDLEIEVTGGVDVVSAFWLEPFRKAMADRGIRTCLSGFLGDELVTNHARDYFEEYLVESRWSEFMRASIAVRGFPSTLRRMAGFFVPDGIRRLLREEKPTPVGIGFMKDSPAYRVLLERQWRERERPGTGYRERLIRNVTNQYAARRIQSEALHGIRHRLEPRYPLADIRLLEYVLALPVGMLGKPGTERNLVRSALKGVLPESVRLRTDKQVAAGVFYLGEERSRVDGLRSWLEGIIEQPIHPLLEPFDWKRARRALDPEDPENNWNGEFYPTLSFQMQCILRIFYAGKG